MTGSHRHDRAEIGIAAGLIAIAAFVFWQAGRIDAASGYSTVGPRFTPLVVAAGLLLVGVLLLRDALAGGWKGMDGVHPPEPFCRPAFLWIAAGLAAHMAIIGTVGFTLASTLLFIAVARGFGSRKPLRDALIGAALAAAVFLFFTRVLNLALPALVPGWI
jgi:putative tricarboxylic transport membrane protein